MAIKDLHVLHQGYAVTCTASAISMWSIVTLIKMTKPFTHYMMPMAKHWCRARDLTMLLVGPGTSMTHTAIKTLAENGCLVLWTGEMGVRFYAQGMGETRVAHNLLHQARLCSDSRITVTSCARMLTRCGLQSRWTQGLTLRQIRGKEGIRVRESYAQASRATGVKWSGRAYQRDKWTAADPINRALSAANSCCMAYAMQRLFLPGIRLHWLYPHREDAVFRV